MSRKQTGEQPPTTPADMSRETGQKRDDAVSRPSVNHKLIPKTDRTGADERKKLVSIGARITVNRLADDAAMAEIQKLLQGVKPQQLYATATEMIDFTARASLVFRRLATTLIPAVRNTLQKK